MKVSCRHAGDLKIGGKFVHASGRFIALRNKTEPAMRLPRPAVRQRDCVQPPPGHVYGCLPSPVLRTYSTEVTDVSASQSPASSHIKLWYYIIPFLILQGFSGYKIRIYNLLTFFRFLSVINLGNVLFRPSDEDYRGNQAESHKCGNDRTGRNNHRERPGEQLSR